MGGKPNKIDLAATESPDALAAALTLGIAPLSLSLGAVEAADIFLGSAGDPLSAALGASEAADGMNLSLALADDVTVRLTEGSDSFSGVLAGVAGVQATISATEGRDLLAISVSGAGAAKGRPHVCLGLQDPGAAHISVGLF